MKQVNTSIQSTDDPLTPAQVNSLYLACDDTLDGRYAFTLLVLLFNTGLALADVRNLRHGHLNLESKWLTASHGLQRARFVPINSRLARAMRTWLQRAKPQRYLFGREADGRARATVSELEARLQRVAMAAGIHFTPPQAQSTLAHHLLHLSADGEMMRSVLPPAEHSHMRLPLVHLPPFSAINRHTEMPLVAKGFIPLPTEFTQPPAEDDIIASGRELLERIGEIL